MYARKGGNAHAKQHHRDSRYGSTLRGRSEWQGIAKCQRLSQ